MRNCSRLYILLIIWLNLLNFILQLLCLFLILRFPHIQAEIMLQLPIRVLLNLLEINLIQLFHRCHFIHPRFITINSTQHILDWSLIITLEVIDDTRTLEMMWYYISIAFVRLGFIWFSEIDGLWLYLEIYYEMMLGLYLFLVEIVDYSWWNWLLFVIEIDQHQNLSVFTRY